MWRKRACEDREPASRISTGASSRNDPVDPTIPMAGCGSPSGGWPCYFPKEKKKGEAYSPIMRFSVSPNF